MQPGYTSASTRTKLLFCISIVLILCGCAHRPSQAVLQPISIPDQSAQTVTILTVTNRTPSAEGGYSAVRTSTLLYERYEIAVPDKRRAGDIRYVDNSDVPSAFVVTKRQPLTQGEFLTQVSRRLERDDAAAMFVHGFNQSFQEALFRLAQVSADAGSTAPAIMFSWPSQTSLTDYLADRDANLASRTEMATTIRTVANAPGLARLLVVGHSMGGLLVMEAVQQIKLEGHHQTLAKLDVVLAAPDIDVDLFRGQLERIGKLNSPIVVLASANDEALKVSRLLGSDRPRLGLLDTSDLHTLVGITEMGVSVIDITSVQSTDSLGHDGYASLAQFARRFAVAEEQRIGSIAEAGLFAFDATRSVILAPLR